VNKPARVADADIEIVDGVLVRPGDWVRELLPSGVALVSAGVIVAAGAVVAGVGVVVIRQARQSGSELRLLRR
jgi:hypothetical protein